MKYTKLTIKIKSNDKPPYFIGSQLRGAFGYALKKVVKKQLLDDNIYNKYYQSLFRIKSLSNISIFVNLIENRVLLECLL